MNIVTGALQFRNRKDGQENPRDKGKASSDSNTRGIDHVCVDTRGCDISVYNYNDTVLSDNVY